MPCQYVTLGYNYPLRGQITKGANMEDRDNNIAVVALLMVAGGLIGAGLALLFAPQSGNKTRKN